MSKVPLSSQSINNLLYTLHVSVQKIHNVIKVERLMPSASSVSPVILVARAVVQVVLLATARLFAVHRDRPLEVHVPEHLHAQRMSRERIHTRAHALLQRVALVDGYLRRRCRCAGRRERAAQHNRDGLEVQCVGAELGVSVKSCARSAEDVHRPDGPLWCEQILYLLGARRARDDVFDAVAVRGIWEAIVVVERDVVVCSLP
ncbi:hypothetical protein B0H10DRAFT_2015863 [Mycena sp. CBHHK59/15]|nr:hypothetical protein B0H10DRAFT_2015863 [Mycena sp. CBHHK59/15]